MNRYECTIMVDDPKQLEGFKNLLKDYSVKILEEKSWGKRLLAYPINKKKSAQYHTIQIEMDSSKLADMRKKLQYNTTVMRYLLLENSDKEEK